MAGIEFDPTGLYHANARYYHPTLQRFISEDPARQGGSGANLFTYAGNSPVGGSDPSGLLCDCSGYESDISFSSGGANFITVSGAYDFGSPTTFPIVNHQNGQHLLHDRYPFVSAYDGTRPDYDRGRRRYLKRSALE